MKTKRLLGLIAPAALTLSLMLSAAVPAYAITSVAATDEQPKSIGDTFDESAPEPAYADEAVNGILNTASGEQTVIYITQEAPAAAVEATAPAVEADPAAASTPPSAEPVTFAPAPKSVQPPPLEVAPEPTQASGQVLGISTAKGANDPLYLDSLIAGNKSLLDNVIANQAVFRNFFSTELLLLTIILPLLAVILFLQTKLLARVKTAARAVRKK